MTDAAAATQDRLAALAARRANPVVPAGGLSWVGKSVVVGAGALSVVGLAAALEATAAPSEVQVQPLAPAPLVIRVHHSPAPVAVAGPEQAVAPATPSVTVPAGQSINLTAARPAQPAAPATPAAVAAPATTARSHGSR